MEGRAGASRLAPGTKVRLARRDHRSRRHSPRPRPSKPPLPSRPPPSSRRGRSSVARTTKSASPPGTTTPRAVRHVVPAQGHAHHRARPRHGTSRSRVSSLIARRGGQPRGRSLRNAVRRAGTALEGRDQCQSFLVTHTRTELVALLKDHGLTPSRALGQNFVVDPNTVRRIARLAEVGPGDQVLEIGAGLGLAYACPGRDGARRSRRSRLTATSRAASRGRRAARA